jgi:hypothetical protein
MLDAALDTAWKLACWLATAAADLVRSLTAAAVALVFAVTWHALPHGMINNASFIVHLLSCRPVCI